MGPVSTFALADETTGRRISDTLFLMSDFPNDHDTTSRSVHGAGNSAHGSEESAPLQNALQAWENEVKTRLSNLRDAADEVEAAAAQHNEAKKKYRNLYRKAETDGIIKTIGKTALRDAGIPTPTTHRRKRGASSN